MGEYWGDSWTTKILYTDRPNPEEAHSFIRFERSGKRAAMEFPGSIVTFWGEGRGNGGLYVEAGIENRRTAHSRHWLPAGMPKRFDKVKVGFLRAFK